MDFLTVQTGAGPLSVVGRVHTDPPRPALLMVDSAFAPKGPRHDLIEHFAGVSALAVDLPGMANSPGGGPTSAELTAGVAQIARRLLGDAPMVVFAASAGSLVALGLEVPNIRHHVLLEPFLTQEATRLIDRLTVPTDVILGPSAEVRDRAALFDNPRVTLHADPLEVRQILHAALNAVLKSMGGAPAA
jgi:pimeloyl-ACP methyl ester carboxylesterase